MSTEVTNVSSSLRGDAVWNGPPVKVRENPERLAWIVLIACFGVFMVLLITVPLTMRYFVQYATSPQIATLDPTQGTVLLYQPGATEPIAITELRKDVVEGSTIVAGDGPTQATLRLISEECGRRGAGQRADLYRFTPADPAHAQPHVRVEQRTVSGPAQARAGAGACLHQQRPPTAAQRRDRDAPRFDHA